MFVIIYHFRDEMLGLSLYNELIRSKDLHLVKKGGLAIGACQGTPFLYPPILYGLYADHHL